MLIKNYVTKNFTNARGKRKSFEYPLKFNLTIFKIFRISTFSFLEYLKTFACDRSVLSILLTVFNSANKLYILAAPHSPKTFQIF